jgi:hypothetical protein
MRLSEDNCPNCKESVNAATDLNGGGTPKVNDFTICCFCAAINKFGPGMKLVSVSDEELDKLPAKHSIVLRTAAYNTGMAILTGKLKGRQRGI